MKTDEQRAKDREWYQANRERVLAKNRARYKKMGKRKKEQLKERKRKWHEDHREEILAKNRARYQNEEYRAKRRAEYAEKHKNDPMTEHRKACIKAQNERMTMTLEERKAKLMERRAEEQAKKDIRAEQVRESQDHYEERMTDLLLTQFREHATGKRKGVVSFRLSIQDQNYYIKRARLYEQLGEKLETLDPAKDYSERNIIGYKRTVIWQEFRDLFKKYYHQKDEEL